MRRKTFTRPTSTSLHLILADRLYGLGLDDRDSFAGRAGQALAELATWDRESVRAALGKVRSFGLFSLRLPNATTRRLRKAEALDRLADAVMRRYPAPKKKATTRKPKEGK